MTAGQENSREKGEKRKNFFLKSDGEREAREKGEVLGHKRLDQGRENPEKQMRRGRKERSANACEKRTGRRD